MAPLSVLPGRLRFETNSLIGSYESCLFLEQSIMSLNGVSEASASHRTGRVLVIFDEKLVSRSAIEEHLDRDMQTVAMLKEKGLEIPRGRRATRGASSNGVGHFMMEMALHAFLPAPLDLLLPAAGAFRR